MANYRTARIIPIALILVIVIVAILGLTFIIRVLFPSDNKIVLSQTDISRSALLSTSADHAVRMTVRGIIVADEDFRSYQIQITPNERILTVYSGYAYQPIDNTTLGNNIPAYVEFVYALNRAKLMDSNELTGDSNDTRGICATGYLYEFQILKADKSIRKLWTSSCSSSHGSLGLSISPLMRLFTSQIPGAQSKIGGIWR